MPINADNVLVEYGTDRTRPDSVGIVSTAGTTKELRVILEASQLVIGGGIIGGRPNVAVPLGAYIQSAELVVTEAFDSAADGATLDLGFANEDGTYTGLDEDGIDVAIAEADLDTVGKIVACNGALISEIMTKEGYVSYDVDSEVFTAGKGTLIIKYIDQYYPDQGVD